VGTFDLPPTTDSVYTARQSAFGANHKQSTYMHVQCDLCVCSRNLQLHVPAAQLTLCHRTGAPWWSTAPLLSSTSSTTSQPKQTTGGSGVRCHSSAGVTCIPPHAAGAAGHYWHSRGCRLGAAAASRWSRQAAGEGLRSNSLPPDPCCQGTAQSSQTPAATGAPSTPPEPCATATAPPRSPRPSSAAGRQWG
jgi:hypothetical protein